MVETNTSPYMHDIELHFTKKKNGHKQEIKKISIEIKVCSDEEIYHWFTM